MLIPAVEDALTAYLDRAVPLSAHQATVSFDPPTPAWAEQATGRAVSMFLVGITRSPQPPRASAPRASSDGRVERRAPLPLVQLSYLVSSWAEDVRAEHGLLGDVLTRLMTAQVLPEWAVEAELSSSVQVALAADDVLAVTHLWRSLGAPHRAGFVLQVTVASDAFDWELAPPSVTDVSTSASVLPRPTPGDAKTSGIGPRRSGTPARGTDQG